MNNIKTKLKSKLDDFGFLYQRYILFREKYFPTKHQRLEIKKQKSRTKFYAQFISKNDLCFDVGAHYGNRSAIFHNLGAKVVAIEPSKIHARYLRLKFGRKIEVVPKGLGKKTGFLDMHISENASNSSFSKEWIDSVTDSGRFKKSSWYKTITVEITTLDELIKNFGIPKFCKIDVEGFELEVLNGLTQSINVLSTEFTIPERKTSLLQVLDKINELDNNYVFNYSFAENMELELENWVNHTSMKTMINTSNQFDSNQYGDLYARKK